MLTNYQDVTRNLELLAALMLYLSRFLWVTLRPMVVITTVLW